MGSECYQWSGGDLCDITRRNTSPLTEDSDAAVVGELSAPVAGLLDGEETIPRIPLVGSKAVGEEVAVVVLDDLDLGVRILSES